MAKDGPRRLRNAPRRRPKPQTGRAAALWAGALLLLMVVLFLVVPTWLTGRSRPTSVLLVTMDATRADALGCYGGTRAATPSLDRLAAEGVRFGRCTTVSPLTLPAHCSLLTSTWPLVHGVRRERGTRLIDESQTLAESLRSMGFATAAVIGSSVLPEVAGLDQGFAKLDAVDRGDAPGFRVVSRPAREVTDRAIETLRSFGERPSFLWVNYHDPDLLTRDVPPSAEAYAAQVSVMDAEIGRLLQAVDAGGQGRKTFVVLVGAQGESLGEHEETGHGSFLYETTLRVPLILRCPVAVPRNVVVDAPVSTIDVFPTILEYLGRSAVADAQGMSLRGLIGPASRGSERTAFAETDLPVELFGLSSLRSLTAREWKYIDSPAPELYNLNEDPDEARNLAAEKRDVVERMRKQLIEAMVAATQTSTGGDRRIHPSEQDRELLKSVGYVGSVGATDEDTGETASRRADPAQAPRVHAAAISRYSEAERLAAAGDVARAETLLREVLAELPAAPAPQALLDRVGEADAR